MKEKKCLCGKGCMDLKAVDEKTVYKGIDIDIQSEKYICPDCGIEAGTIKQAAAIQICIADTYRTKVGLLTGPEIKQMRVSEGVTREQLASLVGVYEKDIKGWETGKVQSRQQDKTLRMVLKERGSYEVTQWPEFPEDD